MKKFISFGNKFCITIAIVFLISFSVLLPQTVSGTSNFDGYFISNDTSVSTSPITIDGDDQLASYATSGDGNKGTPYLIEDYNINSCSTGVNGVTVQNTNKYFIMKNFNVTACDYGFSLTNVSFGIIENSLINNNAGYGIYLENTSNINLNWNQVNANSGGGLNIFNSTNNFLYRNNITNNIGAGGVQIKNSFNSTLEKNSLTDNVNGFTILNSSITAFFSNNVYNSNSGFRFYDSINSSLNLVFIKNSSSEGMFFQNTNYTFVTNSYVLESKTYALYFEESYNNSFISNIIDNTTNGIYLVKSNYNSFNLNTITNGLSSCFYISFSDFNILTSNTIRYYSGDGINIAYSINNSINLNTVTGVLNGITLFYSFNTSIISNTLRQNEIGLKLLYSINNDLDSNTASDNSQYGFSLGNSPNNSIINNEALFNKLDNYKSDSNSTSILRNNNFTDLFLPSVLHNIHGNFSGNQVLLTWPAPVSDGGSPIIEYDIYRSEVITGPYTKIGVSATLSYNDSTIIFGKTYYYRVSAKNSVGEGLLSVEFEIVIPLVESPTNSLLSNTATTSITTTQHTTEPITTSLMIAKTNTTPIFISSLLVALSVSFILRKKNSED